ncbi:unnamed protein product [Callosobruchus maculatus]|uniref:Carboxylic ester hydrolase n=1 Tax=Callosobruchus maculatus TaxID=64391 RepID=A0A653CGG7_CALMS|nr:unnamed protein product [Callosobruchus maculatus]
MLKEYIVCLCLVGVNSLVTNLNERPQVETRLGKVEGIWRTSISGRRYAAFEGIPYAKPPIGDLRFQEPQPIEPWPGTWNATRFYVCPQSTPDLSNSVEGQEDCLYINVYVPKTGDERLLDVVANIHGGFFMTGSPQKLIGDRYIMDKDIVVVSFNYRLGSLGFLSTEDDVVPGNNGLKDQALAMKWIQANIEAFGGNPNSVTLTGFSAGGVSTHLHYFSSYSKGLFHRGISFSGTALASKNIQLEPLAMAKRLAQNVGCNFTETKNMVDCLKTRPASLLVDKTKQCLHPFKPLPCCPFAPVIEKGGKKPFLSDHPYKLLKQGKVQDLPWMTSSASEDGLIFSILLRTELNKINEQWNNFAGRHIVSYHQSVPHIFDKIKKHYSGLDGGDTLSFDELVKLATDRTYLVPMQTAVQLQSKVNKSPVYVYKFNYEGVNSLKRIMVPDTEFKGVCHGDDMIYFLGGAITKPLSDEDTKLKDICMDILYSYATKGVPSINNSGWEAVKKDFVYYAINGPDDIQKRIEKDFQSKKFWESLGLKENEKLFTERDEL